MSTESPTILIVDDDADIVRAAQLLLSRQGMTVSGAAGPDEAWVALARAPVDVILLDLNFARGRTSGDEGFAMLDRLLDADRDAVVVVVTGHSGIAVAVRAMRAGAADFVIKPWSNARLTATVERAVALRRARRETASPRIVADDLLLGESQGMVRVRDLIRRIGRTDAAALVRGPPGTGKSLVARLLVAASGSDVPPVVLDGKGAFPQPLAAGATIVIEGVETIPRLDQRAFAASLGRHRVIATSRLDRAALREALVDDLLYRLNTIEFDVPPLVEREGDALRLARHFIHLFEARHDRPARPLADEAARAIAADAWPDNVRGLRQACERAVLLAVGERYEVADLALSIAPESPIPRAAAADLNLARGERTMVAAALQRHAFNVSRAAAELGLTRAALYRRMEKHGL